MWVDFAKIYNFKSEQKKDSELIKWSLQDKYFGLSVFVSYMYMYV